MFMLAVRICIALTGECTHYQSNVPAFETRAECEQVAREAERQDREIFVDMMVKLGRQHDELTFFCEHGAR